VNESKAQTFHVYEIEAFENKIRHFIKVLLYLIWCQEDSFAPMISTIYAKVFWGFALNFVMELGEYCDSVIITKCFTIIFRMKGSFMRRDFGDIAVLRGEFV
jgi:hypothetical protein